MMDFFRERVAFSCFCLSGFFGYDFLRASAVAKVLNVACNAAALSWFGFSGHVLWMLGGLMAVCGIGGSLLGTHLAIKHGTGFVRKMFLFVVICLICKNKLRWIFEIIVSRETSLFELKETFNYLA